MQLAQQDDLPTFPFHGWFQSLQRCITEKLASQPSAPNPAAENKRNRRPANIADQHNEKTPPKTKEETTTDT
jgi:hypothetical protein